MEMTVLKEMALNSTAPYNQETGQARQPQGAASLVVRRQRERGEAPDRAFTVRSNGPGRVRRPSRVRTGKFQLFQQALEHRYLSLQFIGQDISLECSSPAEEGWQGADMGLICSKRQAHNTNYF